MTVVKEGAEASMRKYFGDESILKLERRASDLESQLDKIQKGKGAARRRLLERELEKLMMKITKLKLKQEKAKELFERIDDVAKKAREGEISYFEMKKELKEKGMDFVVEKLGANLFWTNWYYTKKAANLLLDHKGKTAAGLGVAGLAAASIIFPGAGLVAGSYALKTAATYGIYKAGGWLNKKTDGKFEKGAMKVAKVGFYLTPVGWTWFLGKNVLWKGGKKVVGGVGKMLDSTPKVAWNLVSSPFRGFWNLFKPKFAPEWKEASFKVSDMWSEKGVAGATNADTANIKK